MSKPKSAKKASVKARKPAAAGAKKPEAPVKQVPREELCVPIDGNGGDGPS